MSVQHVLMGVLAEGPAHGYDLKRAYDERFPGAKALAYGQVYSALSRLQQDGLVEVAETLQDGGPERTTYALTAEGRKALDAWMNEVREAGMRPSWLNCWSANGQPRFTAIAVRGT